MNNKRGKLVLGLMALVLFLVLAAGSVAPSVAVRVVEPRAGTVEVWDGAHGLLANPFSGGGSGT